MCVEGGGGEEGMGLSHRTPLLCLLDKAVLCIGCKRDLGGEGTVYKHSLSFTLLKTCNKQANKIGLPVLSFWGDKNYVYKLKKRERKP